MYPYVADLKVVGFVVADGGALVDDDVAGELFEADEDDPDEPLPLQDVMTNMAVSISAAVAPASLIIWPPLVRMSQ